MIGDENRVDNRRNAEEMRAKALADVMLQSWNSVVRFTLEPSNFTSGFILQDFVFTYFKRIAISV